MNPENLKYTKQHEWIRIEGETGTVGITDHAQEALSDITFVELPEVGQEVAVGEEVCSIESCKAASDIYAPVSGKVTEVNEALDEDPSAVNSDPYGKGWIYKIEIANPAEADPLMTAEVYEKFQADEDA